MGKVTLSEQDRTQLQKLFSEVFGLEKIDSGTTQYDRELREKLRGRTRNDDQIVELDWMHFKAPDQEDSLLLQVNEHFDQWQIKIYHPYGTNDDRIRTYGYEGVNDDVLSDIVHDFEGHAEGLNPELTGQLSTWQKTKLQFQS